MMAKKKKMNTFVLKYLISSFGEMLEWLKRHAWKACIRLKCIAGSNPALSAFLYFDGGKVIHSVSYY